MKTAGKTRPKHVTKQRTRTRHSGARWQKLKVNQWVFVALGANLGDRKRNILEAMKSLQKESDEPILRSSIWQTTPVDCPPGSPPFLNAIVALVPRTGETPQSLLAKLQELEKNCGRKRKTILNEPRPLDLDLIAFGNETCSTSRLTLPHPRAHQRRFVLQPLSELSPDLLLPGQSKTINQLLDSLPPQKGMRKVSDAK